MGTAPAAGNGGAAAEALTATPVSAEAPPATPQEAAAAAATEAQGIAAAQASAGGLIDIVTPTGGESVTEGTITEWSVKVGDAVKEGDTVVEISTDKVDMELPAPASGTIAEILARDGETVNVGQVIARMTAGAGNGAAASGAAPVTPAPQPSMMAPTSLRSRAASRPSRVWTCPGCTAAPVAAGSSRPTSSPRRVTVGPRPRKPHRQSPPAPS